MENENPRGIPRVEIWERISAKNSTWERSFDGGKTWEPADWSTYPCFPFISTDFPNA
jgi:hypothetical protein